MIGVSIISYTNYFTFTNRFYDNFRSLERRIVFGIGDFVSFGSQQRIGRIDGIFVHELLRKRRLFIKIREFLRTGNQDVDLGLPNLVVGDEVIVGLPNVLSKKLYIVDVGTEQQEMILVDWEIQYL